MRVIAGQFRGMPLMAPEGQTTRPMTDRVKETVFNILGSRFGTPGALPEIAVLDLFAGSGALGIEAISRGAASAAFVERDRTALRALRGNLKKLKLDAACPVKTENVWSMRLHPPAGGYGLVFCDPPYRDVNQTTQVLDLLARLAPALAEDGVVVFRHDSRTFFPAERVTPLTPVDDRTFGHMRMLLFAHPRTPVDEDIVTPLPEIDPPTP